MRKITEIIVHCSATAAGKDFTAADIDRWHRARGFREIGYHYVVRLDGRVEKGRDESKVGAHCLGHNAGSIGVCYIGGLKADGRTPADTRTAAQRKALRELIDELKRRFPGAKVHGHREFAAKACPCFDAGREYATGVIGAIVLLSLLLASCSSSRKALKERQEAVNVVEVERVAVSERIDSVLSEIDVGADSVRIELNCEPEGRKRVRVNVYGPRRQERRASIAHEVTDEHVAGLRVSEERTDSKQQSSRSLPPSAWWTAVGVVAGLTAGWLMGRRG